MPIEYYLNTWKEYTEKIRTLREEIKWYESQNLYDKSEQLENEIISVQRLRALVKKK